MLHTQLFIPLAARSVLAIITLEALVVQVVQAEQVLPL
jgi:hypothetical protein